MWCKFHRTRSKADIKRGTGYCKKKDINLLKSDCDNCKEKENGCCPKWGGKNEK